ncbi:unnamed protein product [Owenia fusiformis]|uniref:Uncharacterized protein n=1 Tax=Owenia fusiformis TaxID=6347 RepID=A0A8S4Q4M3_OWEFU|nr:unnamed protein product [Owenia fusiformis]
MMSQGAVTELICFILLGYTYSAMGAMDKHGGIQMGKLNSCDNGKLNLDVDWDGDAVEYTCPGATYPVIQGEKAAGVEFCEKKPNQPIHVCMSNQIEYTDTPPLSGKHRPNWARYGEYKYVPPQRWLHNLEHGAANFLYHPCADKEQVEIFKHIAKSCLRRHVITPYRHLPKTAPFAVVTWGCKLSMGRVDVSAVKSFVKKHALKTDESPVTRDGKYDLELIHAADIVSDIKDSVICPEPSKSMKEILESGRQNSVIMK